MRRVWRWRWSVLHATTLLLVWGAMVMPCAAEVLKLNVATDGDDAWSGRLSRPAQGDGPFATLERARDEIRKLKGANQLPSEGVIVEVQGGLYERTGTFELSAEDSGTEKSPIMYRATPGSEVRLIGGAEITNFKPVTDAAALARLDESARGKVYQADLGALGISDFGEVASGANRLELFFQDKPMTISRWPNEGFVKIVDVLNIEPVDVRGTKGDLGGKFVYDGDRPSRWADEKDLWLHGYWFWDWSEQRMKVAGIDTDKRVMTLAPPQHGYGYRKGQWYYALNALCEIDMPGEWHLDRDTGILYFYPPADLSEGKSLVSILPTLIRTDGASFVTFKGFTLEACRNTAAVISGGTGMRVVGCTFRNGGCSAVSVSGTNNGVVGCDIYQMGEGGISLNGGDRSTLTPAGLYAENNHVHHYARWARVYRPGIALNGVGNRASHNLIHDAPHMGMGFGGNDHLIEFNEIHSVCYESNDAGAIYTGRNWTMRGTVLRHNYMHDVTGFEGRGCVGMYLDDMFCGTTMYGNVFRNVTNAAFVGGGRDCTIENNIFVDCRPAVHVDSRAMGWAKYHTDQWVEEAKETGIHLGIKFKEPPYSERYPELVTILDENPWAPMGNLIARNVSVGGRWDGVDGVARPFVKFEDNLVDEDPHFVDAENLNFQLKDDSPAYAMGFKKIPIERIGLYESEDRASWPVQHEVRAAQTPPPSPPRVERTGPPPVFKARLAKAPVTVDGSVSTPEWARAVEAMVIEQGMDREKVARLSMAWFLHDGTDLWVAMQNNVDPSKPVSKTNVWGQDDAIEIAVRNVAAGDKAPILILRGYPNGHFESSPEAGASPAAVKCAAQGVQFAAEAPAADRWTCEWRIPLASLGIDPAKAAKFAINISARKSAEPVWVMWEGTHGCTWEVGRAGFLELASE